MPVGTGGLLSSAIFSPLVFSSTAPWLILNAPSVLLVSPHHFLCETADHLGGFRLRSVRRIAPGLDPAAE